MPPPAPVCLRVLNWHMMGSCSTCESTWSEWRPSTSRTTLGRRGWCIRFWRSAISTACIAVISRSSSASRRGAAEHGGTPMAMTFDPHPPRVLRPDKAPKLLMTKTQRLEALHGAGISCVAVVRFTRELSEWDPETFVRTVLVDWLRVSEVWVGANFLFGHGRSGNFTVLRTLGQHYGFRADKIDPVRYKDFVVSSTRIRRLVSEGRVDEAGALLGHPFFVDGTVVAGRKRGREIGFPTANLQTDNELDSTARRLCDDDDDRWRRTRRHHERRRASDVWREGVDDRDALAQLLGRSLRSSGAAGIRATHQG